MTEQNNRRKLLTIVAWFFIPLVVAIVWYKVLPERFRPTSSTNNGELLKPIFTLDSFSHQTIDGEAFGNKEVEKVWTLVHFVEGQCDTLCSQSLYKTRQLRTSMGKDIDRLDRVAILSAKGDSIEEGESNKKMWASHPDLTVLISTENGVGAQIKSRVENMPFHRDALFLIDPLGNVMMRFPETLPPKLIKKDIRKLFRLSHIG